MIFENKSKIFFRLVLPVLLLLCLAKPAGAAEEVSYDRYASILRTAPKATSLAEKMGKDFLVFPAYLVRVPMDKALIFADEQHLYEKTIWAFDKLADFGITPKIGLDSQGLSVDFLRLLRQKVNYPDTTVQGWMYYGYQSVFEVGSKIGVERIADTGIRTFGVVDYAQRPEEDFWGIGPNTSKGDGTTFRSETTKLQAIAGYSSDPSFSADAVFTYQRVNITNGHESGKGIIDSIFAGQNIPGLDGDEIISIGPEIVRDTRNQQENSSTGGLTRAGFSYNEGLYGSKARYFKYTAEASRFFRLGSNRRIVAAHLYAEYNNETHHHYVPFHQMARLGGYGVAPNMGHTLRSYDENRFFGEAAALGNLEYRYTIWEYRDWKADTVFFWDEGQVFRDLSKFQLKDFRDSYGMGFRVSVLNHVLLAIELAHGDEGTNFYVSSSSPF